uniref:Uncharacterized protein n=1 Tax=Ditylenchus dipsaci TaxID=166011 RepID=A0A915DUE6_9BILA
MQLRKSVEQPIPFSQAEQRVELAGTLNGCEIYHIAETAVIPFKKTTLHLNERQVWFNRHFVEMIQLVLANGGFYSPRVLIFLIHSSG